MTNELGISRRPLVSIGVPVFNGERFLSRAITSLLDQTVADLELIISDNASTDGTQSICEDFVRRDTRIRYVRQRINIGAPRNWNVVVQAAAGKYFKWASASDYCASTMLESCIQAMESDPGVVLCYGRTQFVDENDEPMEIYAGDVAINEERPSERFARVGARTGMNNAQSGVFLLDALRRTRLDRPYPAGDLALMAEIALYGRFQLLPDVLLFRRQSRSTFTSMMTTRELQRVIDPQAKTPIKLVKTRRHVDNLISIARAPISAAEKRSAYWAAIRLARWDRAQLWREFVSLFGGGSAST